MSDKIETVNARITRTMLGYEDHGILTCYLHLDYGGSGQGFGGYSLDSWDDDEKRRNCVAFGLEFIAQTIKTVGVDKWEDLPGKHIRVRREHNSIHAIGHIVEDKWFSPAKLVEQFKEQGVL